MESETRPWICDRCGAPNNGGICTECGADAPLSAFFGDEQNVARHMPYWGKTGISNMSPRVAWGCALGMLAPIILWIGSMIWIALRPH